MLRRIAVLGLMMFALLGVPRPSDAGLLELIWEMSGPQMIGSGVSCLYSGRMQLQECRIGGMFLQPLHQQPKNPHGPFLVLGGSGLVSTSKDSDTQQYGWFDANMVAFEPGLTVFSKISPSSNVRIAHGTGVTYGLLFGDKFRRFDKFGFSLVPIEVSYKRIIFALKIRVYPNGFTDDEFGFGPRLDFDRPAETTYGFSFSYIIR
jgi:hypothetical protein